MPPPIQRPQFHFASARSWLNDPNGLIWHRGIWHLFFQCNPLGTDWGNLSWGHATSPDLMTWTEHPTALGRTDEEDIFSGSCVFDATNSSGLGTAEHPPLVAIYTSHYHAGPRRGREAQSLASSTDDGRSWTFHPANPVLDRGSGNFRDPKVFRHDGAWVMVAVEAEDQQVVFYRSTDLTDWTPLSTFGPRHAAGGAWECPDLIRLPVAGTDETRWVLLVSLNPGSVAGGSGTQYFVGDFDGSAFTPERDAGLAARGGTDNPDLREFDWVDHGRDCYAVVSFAGVPDGRTVALGWLNNWDYAAHVPLTGGRGLMTLPRELDLVRVDGRHRLRQRPAAEVPSDALRRLRLAEGADVRLGSATLRYADGVLSLERPQADPEVHPCFPGVSWVRIDGAPAVLEVDVCLDSCSVEVFTADGLASLSALVF